MTQSSYGGRLLEKGGSNSTERRSQTEGRSGVYGLNSRIARLDPTYLIYVSSSQHGTVVSRAPQNIALSVDAEWEPALNLGSVGNVALLALQEGLGITPRYKFTTAQIWTGQSPIEISLELQFQAEESSRKDVIDPILALMKMAMPRPSDTGLLKPPGPRLFNSKPEDNDRIVVEIGNFLSFDAVSVIDVSPNYDLLMSVDDEPMSATCTVRFRTIYALNTEEIQRMFGAGGVGNATESSDSVLGGFRGALPGGS
jgi:hypothetical protein